MGIEIEHEPLPQRAASSTAPEPVGTAAVGVGTTDARADHVHATGAGTPSTQAFGDAAATGSGPAAAMTDHKHAMPANPVTAHEATYAHGDIAGHIADATDAHDASAISLLDTANDFTATDVEGALAELQADAEAHLADTSSVHEATSLGVTNVKQTAILTAAGAVLATTTGATRAQIETTTNKVNYFVCDFVDASTTYISFDFVLPDNWDGGAMTLVIIWQTTATSGNVRWQVEGVVIGDSDASDTAFGTAATSDEAADATTLDANFSSAISFTPGGTLAGGKICNIRIARLGGHANDTCAATARFRAAKLEYGINALST